MKMRITHWPMSLCRSGCLIRRWSKPNTRGRLGKRQTHGVLSPVQSTGVAPITITEDRLKLAIKDAGDWFAENNRGRKLFMTPRIVNDEIQISIRRGDPFRRKPRSMTMAWIRLLFARLVRTQ